MVEGEEVPAPQLSQMAAAPAPSSLATIPVIDELLDISSLWPLPTGYAAAEPDPVFKRGPRGYHDPFLVAGGFAIPNLDLLDLLAGPMQQALKGQCDNPLLTAPIGVAVRAATFTKLLNGDPPIRLSNVDSYTPNAVEICEAYVDSLAPSDILAINPLNVHITMTNQDDASDVRETWVPFKTGNFILGEGYVFAAKSTDFPGGYFNAGTYDIEAELLADATVGLPTRTIPTKVSWTGKQGSLWAPEVVTGTTDVDIAFPPSLGVPGIPSPDHTFKNQPIARLTNNPTMTVIEAPTIDANWDYRIGLRVNNAGYDGIVEGTVGYNGDLAGFNKYFRADLTLYRVGNVLPIERIKGVPLDGDFNFSWEFTGLSQGNYYVVPMVNSTRILPVPVTGDVARLQVLNVRADFEAPTLDCLQDTGIYRLEGSVHNNFVAPVPVKVTLNKVKLNEAEGAQLELGRQIVLPTRTHFDISAEVGVGDEYSYFATFSAPHAKSVTIDGPDVLEGECAALVDVQWDSEVANNVCPAMTADSTLTGVVDGYREGYVVDVDIYAGIETEPFITEYDVDVDDDGTFSVETTGLVAGDYTARVTLTYNGEASEGTVEVREVPLTVEIAECGALENVQFAPNPATNVCPATTADSTLTGKIANYRADDHKVSFELFVATGDEDDPLAPVEGHEGDITVNEDGTFSVETTGLVAGDYTAVVTLMAGEELVETVEAPLEVTTADCPKPSPEKPGTLPKTGAFVLPTLLVGAGAIGGGYVLKRRSKKA